MSPQHNTVKTWVILGGTSAVATAYARLKAAGGHNILLVGRNKKALQENIADMAARTSGTVTSYACDLGAVDKVETHWAAIKKAAGQIDGVLLAYGVLGDQDQSQTDMKMLADNLRVNFVSSALWAELAFHAFAFQGHGQLTLIGSVAGDR